MLHKIKILGLLAVSFGLSGCSSTSLPSNLKLPEKHINIKQLNKTWGGENWIEVRSNKKKMHLSKTFVRANESTKNLKEVIMENTIIAGYPSAKAAALNMFGEGENFDKGELKIIDESPRRVIYEWYHLGNNKQGRQHIIGLVELRTFTSLTGLSYEIRGSILSDKEKSRWINRLRKIEYE